MTIAERRDLLRALADGLEMESHALINDTRFLYGGTAHRSRKERALCRQRQDLINQAIGLARAAYLIEHELGATTAPGERGGRTRSPQPSPPVTQPEISLRQELERRFRRFP